MQQAQKTKLIQQYSADGVINVLKPYVTPHRMQRIETVLAGRLRDIQLVIEAPSDINNALAAIRSCEALGISHVHIIAPEGDVIAARSVTQGAIYWVEVVYYDSLAAFLAVMQPLNFQLAAAVVDANLPLAAVPVDQPLCILVGNEQRGLSPEAVQAASIRYTIPMFGMTESFNLSVSAAVSLYDVSCRKRAALGANSDLTLEEQKILRARFYLNSTSPRLAQAILRESTVPEVQKNNLA
ncbi:MAG: hypothetical protein A3F10_07105 [Coxiella sp. RIFCSPHIGHO2_12_FULL_42_15]|nr:MAG: hypothetical protein A3F10_07105 [Coxiella sp. RIFCSPHIGHO2_12_FULL_42_15]